MAQNQVMKAAKALIAGGGFAGLLTPRIDLITAFTGAVSDHMTWSQFTVAAYTGYAGPVTVTISAVYESQPSGLSAVDISDAVFDGPSAGAGVNVIGAIFHDTTAAPDTIIYALFLFDGPLSLQQAVDRVTVDETLLLDCGMQSTASS